LRRWPSDYPRASDDQNWRSIDTAHVRGRPGTPVTTPS
jgi:hypothetical protein